MPEQTPKRKKKTSKKVLKQALDQARTIQVPDDAVVMIMRPNGKTEIIPSEKKTSDGTYMQHEELLIAVAALLQNEVFVTTVLKTFRDLYEAALIKQNTPINGIDSEEL